MKTEFEQKVFAIVEHAIELPPHERTQFINESCGDDEDLRKEVLATLNADTGKLSDHGNPSTYDPKEVLNSENQPLPKVAGYEVVKLIGRGGVGSVYQAQSLSLNMPVAIKVLDQTFLSEQIKTRFEQERQILAKLDLPGIARIIDVGTTEQGRPFFCMELIEGIRIDHYCANHHLSLKQRLQLFLGVIELVREAHKNLILHCDLKPDNILVDEKGQARLLDFGIAKILQSQDNTDKTVTGQRMLTPRYASPEQVSDKPLNMVSDVYSLGVLLFRLLTGGNPYRLYEPKPEQLFTLIQSDQRLKASTTLHFRQKEQAGISNQDPNQELTPSYAPKLLEGDIDRILAKAIHPDEKQRYQSVEALADDLQRYLTGHPVLARGDSFSYRATKFIGRNKVGVLSAAVVVFILLGATIYSRIQQTRAKEAQKEAELTTEFLVDLFEFGRPQEQLGNNIPVGVFLENGRKKILDEASGSPKLRRQLVLTLAKVHLSLGLFDESLSILSSYANLEDSTVLAQDLDVALLACEAFFRTGDRERAKEIYLHMPKSKNFRIQKGMADIQIALGEYSEAETNYKNILDSMPIESYEDKMFSFEVRRNLAACYNENRKLQEAKKLLEPLLSEVKNLLGEQHPYYLGVLSAYSMSHYYDGGLEFAETLHKELVEKSITVLGKGHPDTIIRTQDLALIQLDLAKYDEAKKLYEQALKSSTEIYGEGNIMLADIYDNLSVLLQNTENHEEALNAGMRSLEIRKKYLPSNHPLVANNLQNIGQVYGGMDDIEQGIEYTKKGVEILENSGKSSTILAVGYSNLSSFYRKIGQIDLATDYRLKSIEIHEQTLSPMHPNLAYNYMGMAAIYGQQKDFGEAERYIKQALEILREVLPSDHPNLLNAERTYGTILFFLGCPLEAEEILLGNLEKYDRRFGPDHPEVKRSQGGLNKMYTAWLPGDPTW